MKDTLYSLTVGLAFTLATTLTLPAPPVPIVVQSGSVQLFEAGSSFTPTDISGLVLWYDPSDDSTLFDSNTGGSTPSDGGAVGRIEDKSGNGNHARQSVAGDRPLYRATGLNSIGCLDFGAGDFFDLDTAITETSYTAFFVFTRVASGDESICVGGATFYSVIWFNDNILYQTPRDFGNINSSSANTSTGNFVITADDDGAGNGEIWLDGTSVATGSVGTGAVADWDYLGRRASDFHENEMGEVIIYDSDLSVSDRNDVHDYLEAKWGVTIN